jgi:hypothetical protein
MGDCLSSHRKSMTRGEPADDTHPVNDIDIHPPISKTVSVRNSSSRLSIQRNKHQANDKRG